MFSSAEDMEVLSADTPMISADSCRVDTDERRRWWELRFGFPVEGREGGDGGGLIEAGRGDVDKDRGML